MAARKQKSRLFRWLVQLLLIVAIVAGIQHWRTRDAATGPAPAVKAFTIDGKPFELSAAQRPVLVHFWATWCPVCRVEQGAINALAREHSVITVALSSGTDAEIADYLDNHGLRFEVINDHEGAIAAQWGVVGVPTSFIVDAAGTIRFVTSGYTTGPGLRARMWLARKP